LISSLEENHASLDEEAFASIGGPSHKQVFAEKVNASHKRGAASARTDHQDDE
jgi:hypothetical protein